MSEFSKRASGDDELSTWMKEVEAELERLKIIDAPGLYTVNRTDNGVSLNIKPSRTRGSSDDTATWLP